MSNPFYDKLFIFIGRPVRCTRQKAMDELGKVGGVIQEHFGVFTDYVVAFEGAIGTKKYEKAEERDKYGQLVLLTEEQFFDVIDGKAQPPERKIPPKSKNQIISPPKKEFAEEEARRIEQTKNYVVNKKRLENMAKNGVPLEDGGRMKIDFGTFHILHQFSEMLKTQKPALAFSGTEMPDPCAVCGAFSKVQIGDGKGNNIAYLAWIATIK